MAEDDQMTKDQLKLFVSHTLPDASDEVSVVCLSVACVVSCVFVSLCVVCL